MSVHSARGPEWQRMKIRVWQRDNYTCVYCGVNLTDDNSPTGRTVDHLVPVSQGGASDDIGGLVSCCRRDNASKGDRGLPVRVGGFDPAFF